MRIAEHLKGMHEELAKFHKGRAAFYGKVAGSHGKAEMNDGDSVFDHLADDHQAQAEIHESCAAACGKAMDDTDLTKRGRELVPTEIGGVTPDNPYYVRMVPRPGAPQAPGGGNGTVKVPLEFEKMVAIEEG
jgi:hypothetical protein